MGKEELISFAKGLYSQALNANCYYSMIDQYRNAIKKNNGVLEHFPAFYHLTYNALLNTCFMEVAKLYDDNGLSLGKLLKECSNNLNIFPKNRTTIEYEADGVKFSKEVPYQYRLRKEEEIFFKEFVTSQRKLFEIFTDCDIESIPIQKDFTFPELLDLYKKRYCSLSKKKEKLRKQRNELYAHNDIRRKFDEKGIQDDYPISYSDIKELIQYALDLTIMVIAILTGIKEPEIYSNIEDFDALLRYAKIGMDIQKEKQKDILKKKSELRCLVTMDLFEKEYKAFISQADKNAVTTKPSAKEMPGGFPYTKGGVKVDGGNIGRHFGQGRAGKTPYINWHVVSVSYIVEEARIVVGIEGDRYHHLNEMRPIRYERIGNKNVDVAIFYETEKETIDYRELYNKFISVSEKVMQLGLY